MGPLFPDVADRIVAHAKSSGVTLEAISTKAGLHRSTVAKAVKRLRAGEDVGTVTLGKIAEAMGVSVRWLLFGDAPIDLFQLRETPGWAEAAEEAVSRFGCSREAVDTAGLIALPYRRASVNAVQIVDLCRVVGR